MKKLLKNKSAEPAAVEEVKPAAAKKTLGAKKPAPAAKEAPKKTLGKKPPLKKAAPKPEPEDAEEELFPEELESGGKEYTKSKMKFKELQKHFDAPHSGYPFRVLLDESGTGDVVEFAVVAALTSVHLVDISTEDGFEDRILLTPKEFDSRVMVGDEDAEIELAFYVLAE